MEESERRSWHASETAWYRLQSELNTPILPLDGRSELERLDSQHRYGKYLREYLELFLTSLLGSICQPSAHLSIQPPLYDSISTSSSFSLMPQDPPQQSLQDSIRPHPLPYSQNCHLPICLLQADISQFFLWLDCPTQQSLHATHSRSLLDSNVVLYLQSTTQRLPFLYYFDSRGLLRNHLTHELLSTGRDGYIFCIAKEGQLAAARKQVQPPRIHHSSFFGGEPVITAGYFIVEEGQLRRLTAHSGHYRPGMCSIYWLLQYFQYSGVDLSQVEFDIQRLFSSARGLDDAGGKMKKSETAIYRSCEWTLNWLCYIKLLSESGVLNVLPLKVWERAKRLYGNTLASRWYVNEYSEEKYYLGEESREMEEEDAIRHTLHVFSIPIGNTSIETAVVAETITPVVNRTKNGVGTPRIRRHSTASSCSPLVTHPCHNESPLHSNYEELRTRSRSRSVDSLCEWGTILEVSPVEMLAVSWTIATFCESTSSDTSSPPNERHEIEVREETSVNFHSQETHKLHSSSLCTTPQSRFVSTLHTSRSTSSLSGLA